MQQIDTNPAVPGRIDNLDIGTRVPRRVNASPLNVGGGTDIPCIIVSSAAPNNADGRPDDTIYMQTGSGTYVKSGGVYVAGGGGGGTSLSTVGQIIGTHGDSIAGYSYTGLQPLAVNADPSSSYSPRGAVCWANALLGWPFKFAYNGGVSGERTDQILARCATTAAQGLNWVVEMSGRNDVSQIVAIFGNDPVLCENTIYTNRLAIWDYFLSRGINVIACALLANSAALGEASATKRIVTRVNYRLKKAAMSRKGCYWIDTFALSIDPADVGGRALASRMYDSVHPSYEHQYLAGKEIARQIGPKVAQQDGLVSSQLDCYQIDSTNRNILNAVDGLFLSGTSASAGTGVTGTQVTAWTIARSQGAAATAVASVVAAPSDALAMGENVAIGNAQKLVITTTAAEDQFKISYQSSVTLAQFPAGSQYFGECAIRVRNATNLISVSVEAQITFAGGATASPLNSRCLHPLETGQKGTGSDDLDLVLRTPFVTLPVDATGLTKCTFSVYATFSGAGGADVYVYRAAMQKNE
jgi:hypothetical protein